MYLSYAGYWLGVAYALLRENIKAIPLLDDASRNGLPCYPKYLNDRALMPLRSDSFQ